MQHRRDLLTMYRKDSGSASVKATDTLPDCGCAVRLRNVRM